MSKYTTGEMAKLSGVSVRTVQFYDTKQILVPTEITEGGRKSYSDNDLEKLKLICLLKSLSLSLPSIKEILDSENQNKILSTILSEQERKLKTEIDKNQNQLTAIKIIAQAIDTKIPLPLNLIIDIDTMMKEQYKLKTIYSTMGIILTISTLSLLGVAVYSAMYRAVVPLVIAAIIHIAACISMMMLYYKGVAYICPHCNEQFRPKLKEFIFANHTKRTRKLTCANCYIKDFCIEISYK